MRAGGYPQLSTGKGEERRRNERRVREEEMKGEGWKENKKKIKIKSREKVGVIGVNPHHEDFSSH